MKTMAPDAVDVFTAGNKTLIVTFANGEARRFDVTPLLQRKCYAKLNDPLVFAQASVQNGCVTWPDDVDIDPDWLYEDSVAVGTT